MSLVICCGLVEAKRTEVAWWYDYESDHSVVPSCTLLLPSNETSRRTVSLEEAREFTALLQ